MQKTCPQCSAQFEITQDDFAFYDKVSPVFHGVKYSIPEPSLCPDCRQQRRLSFRNESVLYKRKCDFTGKDIISVFSEDKDFTIYDPEFWHSDKWNALHYGKEFDYSRSFSDQFLELWKAIPQIARSVTGNENSDFINQAAWNKNCYLIFEASGNEQTYYSRHINQSQFCSDCSYTEKCELCYECFDCVSCYSSRFLENCKNCLDSWFLQDCIACKNCIGCANLRNKEFHIFNRPYSKEEYFKVLERMQLHDYKNILQFKTQFNEFTKGFPKKCIHEVQNENSSGDYLSNTKNCHHCFNVWESEDCSYCFDVGIVKSSYDITIFGVPKGIVQSYESHEIGDGCNNVLFSDKIITAYNIYYSHSIWNSHDLFGCIGLKHNQYCILNKQYTKEEYEKLVPQIIEHMKKTGEWGEFFPVQLSPFAYNETVAQEYFPLTKDQVSAQGWKWKEESDEIPQVSKVIPAERLPDSIQEIPDDVLNWAIKCEVTQRPFKIQKAELTFYRKMNLPLPRRHPDQRHKDRLALRNPRKLWNRNCGNCGKGIQTSYAPDRPEIVYCEGCYLKTVY